MKMTSLLVLVLEGLVDLHRIVQLQLLWHECLGIDLWPWGRNLPQNFRASLSFHPTISPSVAPSPPAFNISQHQGLCFYLFLAALGLCCCAWAFSSFGKWGLLSSCNARASPCGGFSSCGAWTLEHRLQQLQCMGLIALQHVASS